MWCGSYGLARCPAHDDRKPSLKIRPDQAKRDAIKQFSNWPTIPQVYIDGKFVGGCDIVTELHENGELKPLLEAAYAES